MSKNNFKLKKGIQAILCLSMVLFSGCILSIPKLFKSDNTAVKNDKAKIDDPSVINSEFKKDDTAAGHDITSNKSQNKPSVILGKGYLSERANISKKEKDRVEEQKVLERLKKLETRLKAEEKERKKTSIHVKKLNKKISDMQTTKESVKKDFANTNKALKENNRGMSPETDEADVKSASVTPGSGYLADGSTIELGVMDGDEELKVLEKVKRLESRLEVERNKVKALGEKLTNLQAAKENVEKDFANTKKELEEKNNNLLKEINTLESKLAETESRAIAAEQELNPIKKELLKTQISETKAQQELIKLKIENLNKDEE